MNLETLTVYKVMQGHSLARFGDGELKLCHGEDSLTQIYREDIAIELRKILSGDTPCLVGIPHAYGLRPEYWRRFFETHSSHLNPRHSYVSSFISRPDEAGGSLLQPVWANREVTLVTGGGSLSPDLMPEAAAVEVIDCPDRDAYSVIDDIESTIPPDADLVILCAGATATCLADRLARKNIQGVDLGFIGKFM